MQYAVRHAMPGRLRLLVPAVKDDRILQALALWLERQKGVTTIRINRDCASVLITYKRERRDVPGRIESGLARLHVKALRAQAANGANSAALNRSGNGTHAAVSKGARGSLMLPTLALGLCLVDAPVLTGASLVLNAGCAAPIFRRAWHVLREQRRVNVDFLDSLAIALATFRQQAFTSVFITWLIRTGDWIRELTAARSRRAIAGMLEHQRRTAWVRRGRQTLRVKAEEVKPSDIIVVYTGEMIVADGVVTAGSATVDQKTITGEPLPVLRRKGERVFAGTVVREGKLYVRAQLVGAHTTAAQVVALVESAPVSETRIQNYAEKFADRLVPPQLAVGGLATLLTSDINRLESMAIVDYGTGIRVAAPTSVLASMAAAARRGILIKGGSQLEKLSRLDTVIFDKTGTLTLGEPKIMDVQSLDERHFPARKLIALAASAEARLNHPVALAIATQAKQQHVAVPSRQDSKYEIGMGMEARVNGFIVHVGNERYARRKGISLREHAGAMRRFSGDGRSLLMIGVNGKAVGMLAYADEIRPEAAAVIATLKNRGVRRIAMITGDSETSARATSASLGINEFYAEVMPQNKAHLISDFKTNGAVVAMVGDGINDSAALSHADIGIAMQHGADIAREAADVVLMQNNLWTLITALDISSDAIKLIHQSYSIIAILNTVAAALSVPIALINPGATTLISNGSAILATLNAMRPILNE